jgi:quinol monooxygenase YgiN
MSVREIATFDLKPGTAAEFEAVVLEWMQIFRDQEGCGLFEVHHPAELPDRVILIIEWDTVEAHTEVFANSEQYAPFVAAIEPYYAVPCDVQHTTITYSEQTRGA